MATTVDTLLVRIEADMSDVRRDLRRLENQTKSTQSNISRSLGRMGGAFQAIIGGVLVAQLARGTVALVNFASDMEEMSAMSEAVFGKFIGSVRQQLDEFGNSVGRSRFELEAMAASVQDTFVPLGFARGEAADLSVQLTKLAVDVASFKNELDTTVMNAFQSALVGNHEAVRRFGIVITQADLKNELFRMGIKKNIDEVSAQTKVTARLNLIMAGTVDAQGDAAKTAESFANRSRALKGELDELANDIGVKLLPVAKDLLNNIISLTEGFRRFMKAFGVGLNLDEQIFALGQEITVLKEELVVLDRIIAKGNDGTGRMAAAMTKASIASKRLREANKEISDLLDQRLAKDKEVTEETDNQADATENLNGKLSDSQKFIQQLTQSNEILALQRFDATEFAIASKEAEHELGEEYTENKEKIDGLIKSNIELNKQIDLQTKAKERLQEIEDARQSQQDAEKERLDDLIEKNAILQARIDGATDAEIRRLQMAFDSGEAGLSEDVRAQLDILDENTAKLDKKNQAQELAADLIASTKTEEEKLREQQELLNQALAEGGLQTDVFNQANAALEQKLKEMEPSFKAFKAAAEQAADSVADSLADGLMEGKLSLDSFQDIFKDFVKQLIKEAIKTFIIKQILGAATGGFGFGFGGGGSLPAGDTTFAAFAKGGRIPSRASGGPVLVGERGPELFIPNSAGVIRNNHDTMNMMGGARQPVVNQTININTGVAPTVRAEVMSMMPRIKQETIGAMIDGKKRGNAVAKAFG